jgi:hypothetical protein
VDLKKELKQFYAPKTTPSMVDLPPMPYIMVDGRGDPNSVSAFYEAIEALYKVAYGIRAWSKAQGQVFTVMPHEGLWWWDDMEAHRFINPLTAEDKANFANFVWTLMILQPSHITEAVFEDVLAKVKPVAKLRFEIFHEGKAAQIMHIGSYDDEVENIRALHGFIEAEGYQLSGKHHEIYLSDPRRVPVHKLKTVIRQPMK